MTPEAMPGPLVVRGLTHTFGDRTVLDDVHLQVSPGEAVAVVGPNGSGKSTLLRCVLGMLEADAGEIRWDDRPLDERDPMILISLVQMVACCVPTQIRPI